jgi:predicted RNA polymerase sigma factor
MVRSGDGSEVEPPTPRPLADYRAQPRGCRRHGRGPRNGAAIVGRLAREPALKAYHLLLSVRGDLFHKLGRYEEERAAFEAAAALAANRREHDLLRRRAAEAEDAAMSS